jgi:hypothetical protein
MSSAATDKRISWQALIGGAVTLVTLVGGGIGIAQYYQQEKIPDLTGTWTITNKTAQTSYSAYRNLEVTYTVTVTQSGSDFTGAGTKTTESGHQLSGKAHTPIRIKGTIQSHQIVASYTEQGIERQSSGGFSWKLAGDQKWVGTFYSDAANSSGASTLESCRTTSAAQAAAAGVQGTAATKPAGAAGQSESTD